MPKRTQHKSKRISKLRQKKHSWKLIQLNTHFRRRLRNLGLAFSVLIATGLVFTGIAIYQYLQNPLAGASGVYPSSEWDGQSSFNLMLLKIEDEGNPMSKLVELSVVSIDPRNQSLSLMTFPTDVPVDFPRYGREKISSVYALASLSGEKQSIYYVQKSLSGYLGIPFDGYLLIDQKGSNEIERSLGKSVSFENLKQLLMPLNWPKIPSLLSIVKSSLKTNLSLKDLSGIVKYASEVRFDKVKSIAVTSDLLADINTFEGILEKNYVDPRIYEEGIKMVVLNGTDVPGLASRVGRLVGHLGGNVVDLSNTPSPSFEQSILIGKNSDSYTAKRLMTIFDIRQFRDPSSFSEEDPLQIYLQRGDLILVAGLDISRAL